MTGDIETSVRRLEYGHWLRRRTLREAAERVAALEQTAYLKRKSARFGGPPPKPKPPNIWTCSRYGVILPDELSLTDPVHGQIALVHRVVSDIDVWKAVRNLAAPEGTGDCPPGTDSSIEYIFSCSIGNNFNIWGPTCTSGDAKTRLSPGVKAGIDSVNPPGWTNITGASGSGSSDPFQVSFTINVIDFGGNFAPRDVLGLGTHTFTLTRPA